MAEAGLANYHNVNKAAYAAIAAARAPPRKVTQAQAITLDSLERIPINAYCDASAEVVDPRHITHLSRISQARVIITEPS